MRLLVLVYMTCIGLLCPGELSLQEFVDILSTLDQLVGFEHLRMR
jgi:hypothetical protein